MPTICHRARFLMVGTLRFAHPTDDALRTDLLCAQVQSPSATAANPHDGQITSDFPKSCQARESKIFRLTS